MYLTQLLTIAIVHLLAVMSPGPDFAMVTRNSLIYSRKIGIYTSLGLAFGIAVHVIYSLLGIAFLIAKSIILFNIIKYIGAGYLIYIGYKSLKAKPATQVTTESILVEKKEISIRSTIWTGFLTNVLNPKATLFFLALFTQVIDPLTPKFIQALYGIEMMTMTFIWFTVVSILFSNSLVKSKVTRIGHRIEQITGVVLIALGIKVALASHK
ncbi:MAG: LysE family translocator [Candidatus Taylorbacteria bacterium]|nr:LysE family translocator [Candidatus Taylorbacteria bacterium]